MHEMYLSVHYQSVNQAQVHGVVPLESRMAGNLLPSVAIHADIKDELEVGRERQEELLLRTGPAHGILNFLGNPSDLDDVDVTQTRDELMQLDDGAIGGLAEAMESLTYIFDYCGISG